MPCCCTVTYPTKHKRSRAALSRPGLRGLRGTCRTNEVLGRRAPFCTLLDSGNTLAPATSDLQRYRRHVIHALPTPFDPMLKRAQLSPIRLQSETNVTITSINSVPRWC